MSNFYSKEQINIARWAKALSHPARVHIIQHLLTQSCCYSGDLAEDLPIARSTLSQHLKELKEAGLMETLEAQAKRVWGALGLGGKSRVLDAIVTDFLEEMKWHVERNRSLLELLKERYELGIVSNFYGNLHRVCEDLGIQGLFQCLIDSSCIGVVKPDPRIFQAALDHMSIRPHEAVFVGDNPGRDMEGAKGLGMPHIWLAGEDVGRRPPCCPGDPVIRTLDALGPLLLEGRQADTPREVA